MSTIKSSTEHLTLNADGAGKDIKFQANGVEKASIDSSGNFTSTSIDATKLSGTVPNFTSTGIDDNATSKAMTINSSQNVAIGTKGPLNRFSIYTDGAGPFMDIGANVNANDSIGGINWTNNYGVNNYNVAKIDVLAQSQANSGAMRFYTGFVSTTPTERMRIDSSGNMIWKQSGGQFVPPVNQTVMCGDSGYGQTLRFNGSFSNRQNIGFFYNSSQVGSIITTTSSTSYNTSSDYRLKENVVPMTGSIDRLKALKPSRFNFIADATKTVDGFLAHEAGEVVPECATGTKDAMMDEEYEVTPAVMDGDTVVTEAVMGTRSVPDYQGIDQSKLVPLLVASLQEAVAKIEALEARVTALEA